MDKGIASKERVAARFHIGDIGHLRAAKIGTIAIVARVIGQRIEVTTTNASTVPPHVPPNVVRQIDLSFQGPVDELFPRLDALRSEARALWLSIGLPRFGGSAWFFTQEADIRAGLQNAELFGQPPNRLQALLTSLDPPEHTRYRRLLTPLFSPGAVGAMEDSIRQRIRAIIAEIAPRGSCDFVADVATQFPTRVFTAWMGLPEEQTGSFVQMTHMVLHGTAEEQAQALAGVAGVLTALINERLARPADDLMSKIAAVRLDDRPLTREELFGIAYLLFFAGLDTVAAALSLSFWHLAQTPEDRRTLAEHKLPTGQVVEEMLRRHSFMHLLRVARRDAEFAGVQLKTGDRVFLSLPMASRDPEAFDDPTSVHLERVDNRHCAFGVGRHRCLGSHLARIEMRVAFDEWHAQIPDYRLAGQPTGYAGIHMGVKNLPLRWS
jgi:cytochrome P450